MWWVIPGSGLHVKYCIERGGCVVYACRLCRYYGMHFIMDSTALLVALFSFLFYLGKMGAGEPAVRE
jgi:hypothetical protein